MEEQKNVVHDAQIVQNDASSTQPTEPTIRYSGFWVRGAAGIIDGLIVGLLSFFVGVPIGFVTGLLSAITGSIFVEFMMRLFSTLIGLMIGWGYFVFMTHKFQATVGKMMVGVKVIAEDGQKLSLKHVVIREIPGKIVAGIILYIGYFMIGFTQKKQGLHDMIAHSIVVYTDPHKGPNKIVVGITYGIYTCMIIAMFLLFSTLAALLGWALMSDFGKGADDAVQEYLGEEMLNNFHISEDYSINQL